LLPAGLVGVPIAIRSCLLSSCAASQLAAICPAKSRRAPELLRIIVP
jgi:hypothetical protein